MHFRADSLPGAPDQPAATVTTSPALLVATVSSSSSSPAGFSFEQLPDPVLAGPSTRQLLPSALPPFSVETRSTKILHQLSRRGLWLLWIISVNLLPVLWEYQALRLPLQTLLSSNYSWYTLSARYNNFVVQVPKQLQPQQLPYSLSAEDLPPRPQTFLRPDRSTENPPAATTPAVALEFRLVDTVEAAQQLRPQLAMVCTPLYRTLLSRGEHPALTTSWLLDNSLDSFPSQAVTTGLIGCLLLRWLMPVSRFLAALVRRYPEPWALVWMQVFVYVSLCALSLPLLAAELPAGTACISWWGWGWKGDDVFRVQRFFWLSNAVGLCAFAFALGGRWVLGKCLATRRSSANAVELIARNAAGEEPARELSIASDQLSCDRRLLQHLRSGGDSSLFDGLSDRSSLWSRLEEASAVEVFCTPLWHPLAPLATLYFAFFGFTAGLLVLGVGFPRQCVKAVWTFCCLTVLDAVLMRIGAELHQWRRETTEQPPPGGIFTSLQPLAFESGGGGGSNNGPRWLLGKESPNSDVYCKARPLLKGGRCRSLEKAELDEKNDCCASSSNFNCVVCLDAAACIVAYPCGHRELCRGCCAAVVRRALLNFDRKAVEWLHTRRSARRGPRISQAVQCPLCRAAVQRFLRVVHEASEPPHDAEAVSVWAVEDAVAAVVGETPAAKTRRFFGWFRRG